MRTIHYKFKFNENTEQDFVINLDEKSLDLIQEPEDSYPEWAKLECQKCSNCPLNKTEHEYCPIAKKIVGIVDFFSKPMELEDISLHVETPERTFSKRTSLKSAAVSLIGIYMATSGCPIMDKLRPMARHHLPLATTPETTYRSIANYLIGQYLLGQRGKKSDWELKNLGQIYDDIKIVNTHFRERLLQISNEDYALSAILTLDAHAYYINLSLIGDTFYTIETLFEENPERKTISYGASSESENSSNDIINPYKYRFSFNNDYTKEFVYNVDGETLRIVGAEKESLPSWAKLECNKCPNCPLVESQHKYCPASSRISNAIEFLEEVLPAENVRVDIETVERHFSKSTSLAEGLSAMLSFVITSSGCPVFGKLKPLACHYLPFEAPQEQLYRALGMYLLSQKFSEKGKSNPDWDLDQFAEFFQEVNIAGAAFCARLKEIPLEEENLKMLTNLNCFNKYFDFTVSEEDIGELQKLFAKSYT